MVRRNKFYVNYTDENMDYVCLDDICYIQADKKYTDLYLRSGKRLFSEYSISKWIEITRPAHSYMMPHRSYLINIRLAQNVERKIRMTDGTEIPYSRDRGKEVKEAFRQYMRQEARRYVR